MMGDAMKDDGLDRGRRSRRRWIGDCIALALIACAPLPALARAAPAPARILVVGDSLSAEYGLARGSGWVALLEQRLRQQGIAATVINASISGDTTAGGLSRLPALLKAQRPTLLLIELGANDALRGLSLDAARDNLAKMVQLGQAAGARVVLIGMRMPPNYGRRYGDAFAALYADVARQHHAALVPFLLAGVADAPDADALFQPDGLHPVAAAHPRMLDNVWSVLRPLLGR
jgi:acyl-CoA thioesterase-1